MCLTDTKLFYYMLRNTVRWQILNIFPFVSLYYTNLGSVVIFCLSFFLVFFSFYTFLFPSVHFSNFFCYASLRQLKKKSNLRHVVLYARVRHLQNCCPLVMCTFWTNYDSWWTSVHVSVGWIKLHFDMKFKLARLSASPKLCNNIAILENWRLPKMSCY
jgi:hypothetical protein